MWALAQGDSVRHEYGCQETYVNNFPIAICGHKGEYPIDYNAVRILKCEMCLALWPTYGKEKK